MHYHLEIVMPPTDDVNAAVMQILAPFDENGSADEDHDRYYAFWDWWQLGGRWSGAKLLAGLGKDRVDAFRQALHDARVTVSSFIAGKPTLQPPEQAETVNTMWRDAFPDSPIKECPLFDNWKGDTGDVLQLNEAPKSLTCKHIIIAALDHTGKELEAVFIAQGELWNGVGYQQTAWDGTLGSALTSYAEELKRYKPEWAKPRTPADDWLVVTVDYHS